MGDSKGKVVVGAVVAILLVAVVVGVVVTVNKDDGNINTTNKAVDSVCSTTDYKETCHESLADANSTNPRTLIQTALKYTVNNLGFVLKNSTLLKNAVADPSTKNAIDICEEVLQRAIDDLKRSFKHVGEINVGKMDGAIENLRTWLSAVITFEETCIDAFENTTGDTGGKMKELLKTTKELSSNGLAMTTNIQSILGQLNIEDLSAPAPSSSVRKLLWYERRKLADPKPNVVVAQDGSGQFKSISAAIKTVPKKNNKPFVIFVKAGLYKEYVEIPKKKNFITLIGEGPLKTRITGNKNFVDGTKTYQSATVAVNAEDFTAKDIAFENSAGPNKHQAVALRVSGDRAIFHNVHIDAFQDSLYTHTYRQFYRSCRISGTVDFVFGDALSIFQNCTFVVRKPMDNQACMVTAQGRVDSRSQGAILIQGSSIKAEQAFLDTKPALKAYLGRPWKELSRTIIMNTEIGGFIAPEGWSEWKGDFALATLYYAEYENKGAGADQAKRVKWKGIQPFTPKEAEVWTAAKQYRADDWVRNSGVPYWPDTNFN